jgi:hypothetical protein
MVAWARHVAKSALLEMLQSRLTVWLSVIWVPSAGVIHIGFIVPGSPRRGFIVAE